MSDRNLLFWLSVCTPMPKTIGDLSQYIDLDSPMLQMNKPAKSALHLAMGRNMIMALIPTKTNILSMPKNSKVNLL